MTLPKAYKARDLERALVKKGFRPRDNDHTFFHYYEGDRKTGIQTKTSHGGGREISGWLLNQVRKQMGRLSPEQFHDFVECPMAPADYRDHLAKQGIVKK